MRIFLHDMIDVFFDGLEGLWKSILLVFVPREEQQEWLGEVPFLPEGIKDVSSSRSIESELRHTLPLSSIEGPARETP